MSVDTLIRAAMDAGVQLVLADGKINVVGKGKANVIKPLLEQLRQHKAEIEQHLQTRRDTAPATVAANDPATDPGKTGTRRPPGLSAKLLAASKALDQQIVDAGKSLTPPEAPKPRLAASNPIKAEPPTIKRTDDNGWLKPDAAWKTLAQACSRRLNIDPPCRSKFDPGRVVAF